MLKTSCTWETHLVWDPDGLILFILDINVYIKFSLTERHTNTCIHKLV